MLRKFYIEFLLKLLFLNTDLIILFLIYKLFFPKLLKTNMPIYILILLVQIVFLIFDYILTMFINYSNKHLVRKYKF
jgi:hypothetical protein